MVTAAFIMHSTLEGKQASEPVAHVGTEKEDTAQNKGADKGSGACGGLPSSQTKSWQLDRLDVRAGTTHPSSCA